MEPDATFIDAIGQEVAFYIISNGDGLLRWPDGFQFRIGNKEMRQLVGAMIHCMRERKTFTMDFMDWLH